MELGQGIGYGWGCGIDLKGTYLQDTTKGTWVCSIGCALRRARRVQDEGALLAMSATHGLGQREHAMSASAVEDSERSIKCSWHGYHPARAIGAGYVPRISPQKGQGRLRLGFQGGDLYRCREITQPSRSRRHEMAGVLPHGQSDIHSSIGPWREERGFSVHTEMIPFCVKCQCIVGASPERHIRLSSSSPRKIFALW